MGIFGLRGRKTLGSLSEVAKAFTQRPTRPVALPTGGIAKAMYCLTALLCLLFANNSVSLPLRFMPFVPAKVNVLLRMPSSSSVPEKSPPFQGSIQGCAFPENLSLYASEHLLSRCKRRKQTAAKANGIKKAQSRKSRKKRLNTRARHQNKFKTYRYETLYRIHAKPVQKVHVQLL